MNAIVCMAQPPDRTLTDPHDLLTRWMETGDEVARTHALHALRLEWQGRILRFLGNATEADVWLQDALVELALPSLRADGTERAPRMLAPKDYDPAAWRGRVLRNWMVTRWRRNAREQERWMTIDDPHVDAATAEPAPEHPWHTDASLARLRQALESLPIKPRCLLMLRFGFEMDEVTDQLATALGEPAGAVATRVFQARRDRSGRHDAFLTHSEVRVVFPDGDLDMRRDTARKSMRRALDVLRSSLGEILHDGR